MKSVVPSPRNRRPYFDKVRDRLAQFFLRWLKTRPIGLSASARSRRNRRSRQDQLTIEVLRYRLDHVEAVSQQPDGNTIYSEAFKNLILSRYHQANQELVPELFAQAAGIPVELLKDWLEQSSNPMTEDTAASQPVGTASVNASHESAVLSRQFVKWLRVTRDFLDTAGDEFGWRAHQLKYVMSKVIGVMIRALPKRLIYRHYGKIMELTPVTFFSTGYGATALKQCYQKNLSRGLVISVTLHFFALGVFSRLSTSNEPEQPLKTVRITLYPEFEKEIAERSRAGGSLESGNGGGARADNRQLSLRPFGIVTESNMLLPLRVVAADYTTNPPGPNAPDDVPAADIAVIDVAGLQELANQGVPSSIPGTGNVPLLHFIPKAGATPKIDLASIGGENGTILPSSSFPGAYGRLLIAGAGGGGFNPTLQSGRGGYGGEPGKEGYRTDRAGPFPAGSQVGESSDRPVLSAVAYHAEPERPEKIPLRSFGEKDWQSRDLKKLFHELLAWMEENRCEFPPALKHYMRFKNGDVTARVAILTLEDEYELFMLCNETSEDFGLLLVAAGDSSQAICLRDTGFRKQSFYLSQGVASRNENHDVASVSMLEQRPTLQETSKFYGIFLSWWDKTNAGDQKRS